MTAAFAPLARPSAVDLCADALRTALSDGRFPPGSKLPAERELATQFGVHRVTARAALGRLVGEGLLAVRHGSGYAAVDPRDGGPELLGNVAQIAARSGNLARFVEDLLAVRRHLAHAVLERLAVECLPDDLRAIEGAISALADGVERGDRPDSLAALDLAVLGALLDATHSDVLPMCLQPVTHVVGELPVLRDAMYAEPASNLAGWRALLLWLGQPPSARLPMAAILAILADRDRVTVDRVVRPPVQMRPVTTPPQRAARPLPQDTGTGSLF
jgi:GntR family transcriptional repressor for pyruvate dehydrogenase complex